MTAMRIAQTQESRAVPGQSRPNARQGHSRKSPSPQPPPAPRAHQAPQAQYVSQKDYEKLGLAAKAQYSSRSQQSLSHPVPSPVSNMSMPPRVVRGPSPLIEPSSTMPHGLSVQELKELTRMRLAKQQGGSSNKSSSGSYDSPSVYLTHSDHPYDVSPIKSGLTSRSVSGAEMDLRDSDSLGGGEYYYRDGNYRDYAPPLQYGEHSSRRSNRSGSTSPVSMGDGDSMSVEDVYHGRYGPKTSSTATRYLSSTGVAYRPQDVGAYRPAGIASRGSLLYISF